MACYIDDGPVYEATIVYNLPLKVLYVHITNGIVVHVKNNGTINIEIPKRLKENSGGHNMAYGLLD